MAAASPLAANAIDAAVDEVYRRYWREGIFDFAPGMPYWCPPDECRAAVHALADEFFTNPQLHRYGDVHGDSRLVDALQHKLATENRIPLDGFRVMVTAGANQAYMNALMATCEPGSVVILFAPYYFTHLLGVQLLGVRPVVVPCDGDTFLPNLEAFEQAMASAGALLRAVVLVSPGNPSGAVLPEATMGAVSEACARRRAWLIADEAYEHFLFDGARHVTPAGEHVISIFTLSKSYGLAGWRLGYMVYPARLDKALVKIQDTIPTHASMAAQRVGLAAVSKGSGWVKERVARLAEGRRRLRDVIKGSLGLGDDALQAEGGLYFFIRVPAGVSEEAAVRTLAERFNVLVIPGSSAGMEGYMRINFACYEPGSDRAEHAFSALGDGLRALRAQGEATRHQGAPLA